MAKIGIQIIVLFGVMVGATALAAPRPLTWTHTESSHHVEVVFTAQQAVQDLTVRIKANGERHAEEYERGSLARGRSWRIRFRKAGPGTQYRVDFEGNTGKKTFHGYYTFSLTVPKALRTIDFKLDDADFSGTHNRLRLVATAPVSEVHLVARNEQGETMVEFTRPVNVAAGAIVNLDFDSPSRVLNVDVTMKTRAGAARSYRYTPWSFSTESRGLHFATGSATIQPEDKKTLARVYREIHDAVAKVKKYAQFELYIGGYTDTVGSARANQALSERRARAIAQFMKQQGIALPIYTQGFGEAALAVPTPDNTDAVANRRAVFIVRSGAPPKDPNFPTSHWRKFR